MSPSGNTDFGTPRDARGRFLPGQSGNPTGKRPGTRNRATLIREAFAEGEEMVVARAVIDKAKEGDAVSARFLLGLLCPRPRDRAITLDLPDGMSAGDTVAAFNTTLLAMAAGEITPDEALTITRMFDGRLQALRAWELERQMIWVRREHIPGDELFAPPDEEVEEDEAEVVADTRTEPSPPGRGQGEGSRNSPTGSSLCETGSPHPDPLPEGEGIAPSEAGTISPAPESPAEHLHSACIAQAKEAETAAFQAAQRKLAQWSHVLASQPGFNADAYRKAEVAARLSAAPR